VGPASQAGETVTFIVTNSNNALFQKQPAISPTGTLTFTPASLVSGSATVTVFLKNNGGTANGGHDTFGPKTFQITVSPIALPPSFTPGPDQNIFEAVNPPTQTVPNWATNISPGQLNGNNGQVQFAVTNDNNGLFAVQPSISPTGTLSYQVAPLVAGTATITAILSDVGSASPGSASPVTFHITVAPVNEAPSFTGTNQTATVFDTLHTVPNWATNISTGPATNVPGETLSFIVTTDSPSLFLVQPSVTPNGTLTYQPGTSSGTAHVFVSLKNSGGTANGGNDTFGPLTFTFTINPVASSGSADALWVAQAYRDLLGREARQNEIDLWTGLLINTDTRQQVALQIAHSDEAYTNTLQGLYTAYLGRSLDANGKLYYLGLIHQGATLEQVKAQIFQSNEYFIKNGGTNFGFLTGVYRDGLGLPLDQAGIAFWGTQLAQGTLPYNVALAIVSAPAGLNHVVQLAYPKFLGRTADSSASGWVSAIAAGLRDEDFYASLIASAEYGLKVTANNYNGQADQNWLNHVYTVALNRPIDANGLAYFILQIRSGARRNDITQAIVGSNEYRTDYVQGLAMTYLHRQLSASDASAFVSLLGQGQSAEQIKSDFLGSAEYANDNGNSNFGFLTGVFRDALGTNLDPTSIAIWGTMLAQNVSHQAVALQILQSPNALGFMVQAGYQKFLGRAASASDGAFWVPAIANGMADIAFYGQLLASQEFYVKS
jgi:hypothetical protein